MLEDISLGTFSQLLATQKYNAFLLGPRESNVIGWCNSSSDLRWYFLAVDGQKIVDTKEAISILLELGLLHRRKIAIDADRKKRRKTA